MHLQLVKKCSHANETKPNKVAATDILLIKKKLKKHSMLAYEPKHWSQEQNTFNWTYFVENC